MSDPIAYQSFQPSRSPQPRKRPSPLANARQALGIVLLGLLCLIVGPVTLGAAQAGALAPAGGQAGSTPSKEDEATYERLIDRALGAYQKRDFRAARQLFAEAHLLWENARTLRGLGMAAFELGEYVTAKQHLQEALKNPVKPLTAKLRTATKELLARAESHIGTLVLHTEPLRLKLTVGSTPFDYASGTPIELTAGSHALHLSAPGFLERHTDVDIQGGLTTELKFYLAEVPEAKPVANLTVPADTTSSRYDPTLPVESTAMPSDSEGSIIESPWLWVGVGVLVAATVTTVVVLNLDDEPGVKTLSL